MSTFGSAHPPGVAMRWDRKKGKQQKLPVECPGIVQYYNTHMGGVDKMDALMGFYRMFFRSHKWPNRIFFHFMDLCLNEAWLLYRRDFESVREVEKDRPLTLYQFKSVVSYTLRNQNKPLKRLDVQETQTSQMK